MTNHSSKYDEFMDYLREHPEGATMQQLANHFGLNRSTIHRYCKKARKEYTLDDERGIIRLRNPDRLPTEKLGLTLTPHEIAVLNSQLERASDSPTTRGLLEKLRATQGQRGQQEFDRPTAIYLQQQHTLPEGLFDAVVKAIEGRLTLKLTYRNKNREEKTYLFDPYVILPLGEHLHLVGSNHRRRAQGKEHVHRLRLDSLVQWEVALSETPPHVPLRFKKPDFNPQEFVESSFLGYDSSDPLLLVQLEIHSSMSETVARTRRHRSQQVEWLDNGNLLYQLEVPITPTLVAWILSYGSRVLRISPEPLRKAVLKEASALIALHLAAEI